MAFTTSPVPMDLASLRLRALQRDMSAAATDAAATVFTAAPVMEALSRHLEAAHSKEQPASSAAAKSGAALLNDQVRDSLERRLRTEDEERQHLAQRILAAQRTCTAAVSFQQGAAEMPRVGLAGGATAGALVERARALVAAQVPSACPAQHQQRPCLQLVRAHLVTAPQPSVSSLGRSRRGRTGRVGGRCRIDAQGAVAECVAKNVVARLRKSVVGNSQAHELSPLFTGGAGQRTTNLP